MKKQSINNGELQWSLKSTGGRMKELYCVCGNRVYPDTGGYTCNRCFRRYSVKGKLTNSFYNSLIQFCDRADKLDDKTMQYHEEEE